MGPSTEERRRCILPAMVVGDALGYPLNGLRGGHIQQLVGVVSGPAREFPVVPGHPPRVRAAGLNSALGQTVLAIGAARSDDTAARGPLGLVGGRLLELAGDGGNRRDPFGALRAPGRPLARAIMKWREDHPWDGDDFLTASSDSVGAAGAAASLAAVGCGFTADDAFVDDVARITHSDSLALEGARAIARVAEMLLADAGGKRIDARAMLEQLVAEVGARSAEMAGALEPLASLLEEENDTLAASTLLRGIERFQPNCAVTHVAHGFAPVAVPWAIYWALGRRSPRQALEGIANAGGEVCTLAAIVGGLMAARYGREAIPEEWPANVRAFAFAESFAAATAPDEEEVARWIESERAWSADESTRRFKIVGEAAHDAPPKRVKSGGPSEDDAPPQEDAEFAPPPDLWFQKIENADPAEKKRLKEARARARVPWKEERRRAGRGRRGEE